MATREIIRFNRRKEIVSSLMQCKTIEAMMQKITVMDSHIRLTLKLDLEEYVSYDWTSEGVLSFYNFLGVNKANTLYNEMCRQGY